MYLSTHRPCSVPLRGQTLHGWVVVYHKDQYYSVSCRALFSSKAVHKTIWLSNLPVEGGSCEGIICEHSSPTARKHEEIKNDKKCFKVQKFKVLRSISGKSITLYSIADLAQIHSRLEKRSTTKTNIFFLYCYHSYQLDSHILNILILLKWFFLITIVTI